MASKHNRIDLEGKSGEGLLGRKELASMPGIRIYLVTGSLADPLIRRQDVHDDRHVLSLGLAGTLLYVDPSSRDTQVLPGETALYLRGEARTRLYYSRGKHHRYEFEWHSSDLRSLNQWASRVLASSDRGQVFSANIRSLEPRFLAQLEHVHEVLQEGELESEPFLLSCIHEMVGASILSKTSSCLVSISEDAPLALKTLMAQVKGAPAKSWSLKEAATYAGYSPFHLSRTFRTSFDYGFPEFVDRCRTEYAIRRLLDSDLPIEDVAASCGFGSTQGLRESFKEHLGLLPSELRTLTIPDNDFGA